MNMDETTLLTIIAAAALLSTVAVVAVAFYVIQLGRALVRLERHLSSLVATIEEELRLTLHEVRETSRGVTSLTDSARHLLEQVIVASVISRVAPTAMRAVTGLRTGIDVARSALGLYERWRETKGSKEQREE